MAEHGVPGETLGLHTGDQMVSFYMQNSGFMQIGVGESTRQPGKLPPTETISECVWVRSGKSHGGKRQKLRPRVVTLDKQAAPAK
jgi:hypothetical protein